jgi:aspartate aminotransferase-like enzyme
MAIESLGPAMTTSRISRAMDVPRSGQTSKNFEKIKKLF